MKFTKLKLLKYILISNFRHLTSTIFFYAITSVLLFFIIILNDSLNTHISSMFPKEFFITAYLDAGTQVLDVSQRVFTPNFITRFNNQTGYTIVHDEQDPEIKVRVGNNLIPTSYTISFYDDSLSVSEYFAETHEIKLNTPIIIQGRYFNVDSIHNEIDDPSPLILPMNAQVFSETKPHNFKIKNSTVEATSLKQLLRDHVDHPHIYFDILTFDIEEALTTLVNILFGMLFAVGVLVFIVASFNIKSMTILSITKRQREIVLYYLYGLPKKDLFFIFQIESLCVHLFSLLLSYVGSLTVIYLASLLLSFGFDPALFKAALMSSFQVLFVQRITRKILMTCIHESIAKI